MNRSQPNVDKYGFPIPRSFNDLPPNAADSRANAASGPTAPRGAPRAWRWFLLVLGVAMVAAVIMKSPLGTSGRELMARWAHRQAVERYLNDDLHGAVRMLDRAWAWKPGEVDVLEMRAALRLETGDLAGSLADYNRLEALRPHDPHTYMGRSQVYLRQGNHHQAIDDLTQAVTLTHENESSPLNSRAYARAIANVDLEAGLADVDRALALLEQRADFSTHEDHAASRAAYLDTRGYLLHLLERHDEALADMDEALRISEAEYAAVRTHRGRSRIEGRMTRRRVRMWEENLAVMYHHRGLIHQALDNQQQAQADLRRGDQLGYNPAAGVF